MFSSSNANGAQTLTKTATERESERRLGERHTFTASAEVIELASGARFSTRTTDLGPGGCFVDTTVPFPVGSKLLLTLQKGDTSFQSEGTVVYAQHGLGMGIAFKDHDPEQRVALGQWLAEITGRRIIEEIARLPQSRGTGIQKGYPRSFQQSPDRATLVRLVQLLIGKGILTDAEGTSVLHEPVL
jgi:Tfp pilus assembly protein PilZ